LLRSCRPESHSKLLSRHCGKHTDEEEVKALN
jgi:hypothetical protein